MELGTQNFQAGLRCVALSARCPRASATVHTLRKHGGAKPAPWLSRHWAALLPSSRHIPHPLMIPARGAHRFALPPFDIQVILGGASGPWAPSGSGIRRDAAPQTDAESHSAPLPQSRSAGVPPRAAAPSHDPVTPSAPLGPPLHAGSTPADGVGWPRAGCGPPQQAQDTQDRPLTRPRTPSLACPAVASHTPHRDQNGGPKQPPLAPLCTYIQSLVCSMSF